jgi:malonate decarboxylase epsilon subunit
LEDSSEEVGSATASFVATHDGTRAALQLESRAVELGALKAELLHISVPSHCPLLQPIAKSLREQLRSMQIRDPQFVYVSNVKARAIRSGVGIATDLADNIAYGVRWHDATQCRARIRLSAFLEMPPGHALSDLVRENLSEVEAYPVVSGSIDRLLKRVQS